MLWYYLKAKMIYPLMAVCFFAISCSSSTSSDGKLAQEFYDKAKRYEAELPIFFNVSFTARGYKDNRPFILRIEIALDENETIILPGIAKGMNEEEIKEMPFYENIEIYSDKMGLVDSVAYQKVKDQLIAITDLAHELKSYKIQSTPRLGRFIIFSVSSDEEVIYVPNVSKVNHEYWKKFFCSGKKLGDNWYYRNVKSN
ncbi:hypothetical protein JMN32_25185 [Fulvivirga sp. 29W222]|uniref:Lipoprotein n=1 Tax=Fulvivirga marina TaxID=2494733 RepID=A0A937KGN9_9BACT|nr:hypothetical protein [Fulvivirga marina]MBL6449630.1 hypothetical protein [Fulvivirga marina]